MNIRKGYSLIEVLVVIAIIGILVALTLAALQHVRAAAAKTECGNRLRQLALGITNYANTNGSFPPGCSIHDGKSPTLYAGYQIWLLPYIEQGSLFIEAQQDYQIVQWPEDPQRHRGFSTTVKTYICPADPRIQQSQYVQIEHLTVAFTSYLGVCGNDCVVPKPDGMVFIDSTIRFSDVTDGLSSTLLIGERPPEWNLDLGWWYAGKGQADTGSGDMILGVREHNQRDYGKCPPGIYQFVPGSFDDHCGAFHFWSPHSGGAWFAFGDASVRFLSYEVNPLMPALSTRAGREVVSLD